MWENASISSENLSVFTAVRIDQKLPSISYEMIIIQVFISFLDSVLRRPINPINSGLFVRSLPTQNWLISFF